MDLYRRMAAIRSQEDADDLLDEIVDRYGEPPKGVLNLIDIALLRAKARQVGIKDIRQKSGDVLFTLSNLNFEAVGALCSDPDYKQRVTFLASARTDPPLQARQRRGQPEAEQAVCGALYQLFPELTFWEPLNKSSAAVRGSFSPTLRC